MAKPIPIWREGKRSGYDPASRRYRDASGAIVPKNVFRAGVELSESSYGFSVNMALARTPISNAMEKYDQIIRGADKLEQLIGQEFPASQKRPAQPIPYDIRAAYNLVDYYTKTEGDVFQHIEAPIDIAVNPIVINCPDDGARKELERLYSEEILGMQDLLYHCWLSLAMYGVAYPLEVYDNQGYPIKNIILPPRFVWVGYYVNYGEIAARPKSLSGKDAKEYGSSPASPYALLPFDVDVERWTEDLVESTIMPITYNSFTPNWNEQIQRGMGIPLLPDCLHPIRGKSMPFQRFPYPPLSRAFRAISSRIVFEEMVRATIEGYRNQLWVFILGDADHKPSYQEMAAFRATLDGMSAERTGYLVWRAPVEVQQHSPKPLDQMLSNETFQAFTLQIFRMLGSNVRLITSNPLLGQRSDTGLAIDLSVWLKRLEFLRNKILGWEGGFRKRMVDRINSPALIKANEKTTVTFSRSLLEVSDLIERELRPLYSLGMLSPQTALTRAGYNYDVELANKKEHQPNADLMQPPTGFVQTSFGQKGPSTTRQPLPQGRTPDNVNPNKVTGDEEFDKTVSDLKKVAHELAEKLTT